MDMLHFTDDIHKRSASFSTACLKSDSTLVRSIAEFVTVGRCRTAGWNCFRMATAVRSSVKLMASVLRWTSPTYVASNSSSLNAVGRWGRICFIYSVLLDQRAYLMVLLACDCIAYRGWPKKVSHKVLSTSLPNMDRFSKFFHCCILWKICRKWLLNIPRHLTTSLHYLVKYKMCKIHQ